MFTCRVKSLITCIQFRLFIKDYLTNWCKFCIDWHFEHFGENYVIYCKRLQSGSKLNFVQFFLDHSVYAICRPSYLFAAAAVLFAG